MVLACGGCANGVDCRSTPPTAGKTTCMLDDQDRQVDVYVPSGDGPWPLVLSLHGGGGARIGGNKAWCRDGDVDADNCLAAVGTREGFVVVSPDGFNGGLNLRTWNAGGGADGWHCISGNTCANGEDDVARLDALLDFIASVVDVDEQRIYVTGISNGGAMAYRLACERSDRVAAIAPIGAGNQVGAVQGCTPSAPVPVLHLHGTDDPAWLYDGGDVENVRGDVGRMMAVSTSVVGTDDIPGWVDHNGCDTTPTEVDVANAVDDGTTSREWVYRGCTDGAEVRLVESTGGGHTIPGGWQYQSADTVGPVVQDFDASERVWQFFNRFSR